MDVVALLTGLAIGIVVVGAILLVDLRRGRSLDKRG